MHEKLMKMITITSISISNSKESPLCIHANDFYRHIKITYAPSQGGVVTVSKHHTKILCQSSEMLAFKSMQRMHLLEAFLFLQKSYFAKYTNTNISNTVPKPVSNIFEINLKIN